MKLNRHTYLYMIDRDIYMIPSSVHNHENNNILCISIDQAYIGALAKYSSMDCRLIDEAINTSTIA